MFSCLVIRIRSKLSVSSYYIGAIFEVGTDEMQAAFRHAVSQFNRMNESANGRRYELQAFVDVISTADTVKLSRLSKSFSFLVFI